VAEAVNTLAQEFLGVLQIRDVGCNLQMVLMSLIDDGARDFRGIGATVLPGGRRSALSSTQIFTIAGFLGTNSWTALRASTTVVT